MDSTKRFSNRVDDYTKFRPSYPAEIIAVLEKEIGLDPDKVIADIGSGTGFSSVPFLKNGNMVYGIEPNREMREVQERLLQDYPKFRSIDGTAERTTLLDKSVHVIVSAQAFHWFDKEACKLEFSRILKDQGHIVLAWNARRTKTPFQQDYDQVLHDHLEGYKKISQENLGDLGIVDFFSPRAMKVAILEHDRSLDLEGMKGMLKSSSYCPKEGLKYERLMMEMEGLFAKYQQEGRVSFSYETLLYWC